MNFSKFRMFNWNFIYDWRFNSVLVSGIVADFWGRKRVILVCIIIFSTFTFSQGPTDFAIYRFIAGQRQFSLPQCLNTLTKVQQKYVCWTNISGVCNWRCRSSANRNRGYSEFWLEMDVLCGCSSITNCPFMIKYMPESLALLDVRQQNKKVSSILQRLDLY